LRGEREDQFECDDNPGRGSELSGFGKSDGVNELLVNLL